MNSKKIEKELKKNQKRTIIIVSLIILVLVAIISFFLLKINKKESNTDERTITVNELSLELGEKIPVASDFSNDLTDYEVIIDGLDSETLDIIGTFNVTLKNDKKEYQTKITVQDTLAPTLVLKEVTITEGEQLSIDLFIESCEENSKGICKYSYTDESSNEIESIDLSVGEHVVNIIAKDETGNRSKIQSTKLIVNKKTEEKPTNNNITSSMNNTTTNNNSNKKTTTTKTSTTNNKNTTGINQSNSTGNNMNNDTTTNFTCTPAKSLPSGAVWYKTWGNTGIDYGDYGRWADTVNEMQILMDEAKKIPLLSNMYGGRTIGGLIPIWCKEDTIGTIYGAYFEINGYPAYRDENGVLKDDIQQSKGYMDSSGKVHWVYKNY